MKKVYQTVIDKGKGNCMQAGLASMFELDITQVPNLILYGKHEWFNVFWHFLLGIGYEYKGSIRRETPKRKDLINGCVYATVKSKTFKGAMHTVLINSVGRVIHDPNPNKKWLDINIIQTNEMISWLSIEKKD